MRCRSGGIRVRTEQGAKLIIKPLQKPSRHSPLPKSEWILMIKQSAQTNEMQKHYTLNLTYTLSLPTPPPPSHTYTHIPQ